VTTLAGGGRQGFQDGVGRKARFNYPEGIAYDADYHLLYVAEFVSKLLLSDLIVLMLGDYILFDSFHNFDVKGQLVGHCDSTMH